MPVRSDVNCSECGKSINRVTWNYSKERPITEFFCDNTCKGTWQRKQREALGFTKDWLYEQYFVLGKGTNQIGREIGRDGKRVWEWIRDYGFETRARGSDENQHFKKGHKMGVGRVISEKQKEILREARKRDGRKPCYKDGVHWLHHPEFKGRKPASYKGGITPERQAFYSTQEWSDAVKEVWARDDATCQRCGKHHNQEGVRGSFHIHHIVSFMVPELRAEVSNLVLLCRKCHFWVHSNKNVKKDYIKELANDNTD